MRPEDFLAAEWPAPPGVVAGTSFRTGGESAAPWDSLNLGAHVEDEPAAVAANRQRLREYLELPAEPSWMRQVHGNRVLELPQKTAEPEADGCWTTTPGTVCVVMTADCLPVLFCDRAGSVVAAAHAGWRGLAAGVLEETVSALPARSADLLAWLGPAISQPAFEVGDEVRAAFVEADAAASACFERNPRNRWQADLYALARLRLERSGVREIFGGDRCTYREPDRFFSYRRDGRCGRMASLIFLSERP